MATGARFVAYAGNLEDVLLWRALRDVEAGFWIDVGAYAPVNGSTTRAFSERGWRGINIEPNPALFDRFPAARPRDVNLNVAAGAADGELTFHVAQRTGLSTLDAAQARRLSDDGIATVPQVVPVRSLDSIWEAHVPPDQPVHFLKIDVEGYEASVVAGNDWERHRPWIAVIEATRPLTTEPSHEAWEGPLLAARYDLAHEDGLNRFYVAREHAELLPALRLPPNVFDAFVTHHELRAIERAARLEAQVAAMRASASWRLTRPLRAVGRVAHRLSRRLPRG
ncbi:MAG TPA: FkbM family methyltransferase [Candidatus Limnocylindrales bacterium]